MKKITTILLCAISGTLFAQLTPPGGWQETQAKYPSMPASPQLVTMLLEKAGVNTSQHSHKLQNVDNYIPIYDSIYYWNYDTAAQAWPVQAYGKYDSIVYDNHNNMLIQTYYAWSG